MKSKPKAKAKAIEVPLNLSQLIDNLNHQSVENSDVWVNTKDFFGFYKSLTLGRKDEDAEEIIARMALIRTLFPIVHGN